MIGKTISHYKILEKLGEGGMGVVYKAHDTKLERILALKFLPFHLTKSDPDKARFLQEARAAAALNHPNVCTIHEIHDEGDSPFIVMEYVEGRTLRDIIHEINNLPKVLNLGEVVDSAIQIGEALKAAHSKSIIHRDIKSENIMVTETGQVKVMDFGLAKLRGSVKLTKTSSTVGTIAYMSPENIKGQEVDARSDIFSFAVVLYEMLTGQLPFKGEYDSAMLYAILNEEPEPVQKYRSDLSSELLHVLNRALEKDPDERYQSINDMLIDLKRLKRDTDRISRKTLTEMPVQPARKKSVNSKIGLWLFAGAIALAVILFILFQFIQKGSNQQSFKQMQITQVTTHGKAKMAAISPDGKYIVHVMKEQGKESLWLRQVATGSNVEIFPSATVSFKGLTFSSDGNYIYYVIRPVEIYYGTLYRLPVLGGTPVKVCERVNSPVTLSPDSKKLAFIRLKLNPFLTELILFDISLKKEDTLSTPQLTGILNNQGLSWSPDGHFITCAKEDPRPGQEPEILVDVSVADGSIQNISSKRWGAIDQIAWLRDGSGLIVSAADQSTGYFYRLWFVPYPEGQAYLITPGLNNYLNVSLTQDMKTILTTRSEWS
ncbi:MAG: serine/threonine-protein kinase, partial [Calditrichaeota bacterium]|nr:serine/threonine-protein kinase [Calditrichota bacterium]